MYNYCSEAEAHRRYEDHFAGDDGNVRLETVELNLDEDFDIKLDAAFDIDWEQYTVTGYEIRKLGTDKSVTLEQSGLTLADVKAMATWTWSLESPEPKVWD